jgi:uncharacterized protein (TIGR03435 family)
MLPASHGPGGPSFRAFVKGWVIRASREPLSSLLDVSYEPSSVPAYNLGVLWSPTMRPTETLLALACLLPTIARAQTPSPTPQFEVATIKPIDPTSGAMHMVGVKVYPGGRVAITTFSLKALICTAFEVSFWQLKGGDAWTEKQMYDLEAKPAQTDPPTTYDVRHSNGTISDERLRLMLQALLIERFQLKFHRDNAPGQVFLLEKSGKPIPLIPTKEAYAKMDGEGYSGDVGFAGNRWVMYNTSMPQFANFASRFMQKPVLDRTGIDGAFDFRWTVQDADPNDHDAASFTNTYQTSFPLFVQASGLKLTKSTGPIETFVIDHADLPTAN